MTIRPERPGDRLQIRHINQQAFDDDAEANLIDALRDSGLPLISLVAEERSQLIGHILFSPVRLIGPKPAPAIAGLAPMAVLPDWQGRGVGSSLVTAGLDDCAKAGYVAVVVLGHPDYYPRFGFVSARHFHIQSEYDVADDVFMLKELQDAALEGISGTVQYHPAFQ